VTNSPTDKTPEHPDALLLPCVEGALGSEDLAIVTAHLAACERCSAEVKALQEITVMLRDHKQALCPQAREIFEAAKRGPKIEDSLSRHLELCPQCRSELESYLAEDAGEQIPRELWSKIRNRLAESTADPDEPDEEQFGLWERISRWFRLPALGVAAVAAILVVFLVYPREGPHLPVGMSSVNWEQAPRPKAPAGITRPRTAVLILFKQVDPPVSRQRIDTIYQALEPPMDMAERFDLVTPAMVSEAIKKGRVKASNREELLVTLRTGLDIAQAVLVTVNPTAEGFSVESELVSTETGRVSLERTVHAAREQDLASVIRDTVWALLLKTSTEKT